MYDVTRYMYILFTDQPFDKDKSFHISRTTSNQQLHGKCNIGVLELLRIQRFIHKSPEDQEEKKTQERISDFERAELAVDSVQSYAAYRVRFFGSTLAAELLEIRLPMLAAFEVGDPSLIAAMLHNRLVEPALAELPSLNDLSVQLRKLDMPGYQMTGSGSTFFVICRHQNQARNLASRLRQMMVGTVLDTYTLDQPFSWAA